MNSRVYPTYKTKYRVANWASYHCALVGRGDVTLWVSLEAIATWAPAGVGTRGGRRKYSDVAIETACTSSLKPCLDSSSLSASTTDELPVRSMSVWCQFKVVVELKL